ncbi:choice-of-anchor A family protein [Hyalangium versicolor]|uniref:choice-of-anchor A family protein n=1 Tax=Hyalangium versicolor TaxID=2861190 RepID=UPI001CCEC6A7|nr:choice-of-anchor A family protein [Hyalangium versicolor]
MTRSWRAVCTQLVALCLSTLVWACGPAQEEATHGSLQRQREDSLSGASVGRIVVSHDEWTLSNTGFNQNPNTAAFARNVASWLGTAGTGRFLVYSNNFGLRESTLAAVMTGAGYTWTATTSVPFTLSTLLQYDAVFIAGDAVDTNVLTQYVRQGGGVYIAAGTGLGAAAEAALWNPFLNSFGLSFAPAYNGVCSNASGMSAHPIVSGVPSLYSCNGNSVSLVGPASPYTSIVQSVSGQGLLAVYDGCPSNGHTHCFANLPPTALCTNVTVSAGPTCTASASINSGSHDSDSSGSTLQLTQSPAGPYPLGTTPVTLTVSDGRYSSQCTGTVTVMDDTPPTLQCPADLQLACTQSSTVSFAPTFSDNCGGPSTLTCTPSSGSSFPSGTTSVTCFATDSSGIPAGCSFNVTVAGGLKIHLSDYNLFLREDYSQGHDVQGKVAAGGNITLTDFAVGSGLAANDTANTLVAGGSLNLSRGGVWGDAWYGGSYTPSPSVVFPRGTAAQGAPIDFAARFAELHHLSSQLASRQANGTTTRENWGGIMLRGASPDMNFFDVNANAFTGAALLSIDAPAGSLAVLNIRGASATFTGFGTSFSGGIGPRGVLYNFVDATSIHARGFGFQGTVLAPAARIDFSDGSWDGGIYALSLTGNAEGHINPLSEREICE